LTNLQVDIDALKAKLKEKNVRFGRLNNPLKLSMWFLKSEKSFKLIQNKKTLNAYVKFVVDTWKPDSKKIKEIEKKKLAIKTLPKIIEIAADNIKSIKITPPKRKVSYQIVKPKVKELLESYRKKLKDPELLKAANPLLTVGIRNSYTKGLEIQKIAKYGSSIEGIWGKWIEEVIPLFNSQIIFVGSGDIDCILGNVCYDIKAGPRVFNKGQVEHSQKKRSSFKKAATGNLRKIISCHDYKIAVSYGHEEIAMTFMKNSGGLIIFGPKTWKELTGDELNLYRVFLWTIRYVVEESNSHGWTKTQLDDAVDDYLKINYGNGNNILKKLQANKEYKKIKKMLK